MKLSKLVVVIFCSMFLLMGSSFAFAEKGSSITTVFTTEAPMPVGGYSQGKLIDLGGGRKMLKVSGQIAFDPQTGKLVDGDIVPHTNRVMLNIGAVLKAAGMGFDDVVKVTVYLAGPGTPPLFEETYAKYFSKENPPVREKIGASWIPGGSLLEVSAEAYKKFPEKAK